MSQVLTIICAFALLSLLTLSVNRAIINKTEATYQSESMISASTMAQALIQEVSLRAFDERTITTAAPVPDSLTPVGNLGKEGETYPLFDDLDDYKGFVRNDTIKTAILTSSVDVEYAVPTSLEATSGVRTFYKRITVTVSSTDTSKLPIPLTLSSIVTY